VDQTFVVACELNTLPPRPQELDGGQVQRIQRSDWGRKRFERSRQDVRSQLYEGDPSDNPPCGIAMRTGNAAGVKSGPELVPEQSA
jgi:hypothetical protein